MNLNIVSTCGIHFKFRYKVVTCLFQQLLANLTKLFARLSGSWMRGLMIQKFLTASIALKTLVVFQMQRGNYHGIGQLSNGKVLY